MKALLADCLDGQKELDYLRPKVAALEKLTKQDAELIATYEAIIAAQDKRVAALNKALEASGKIEGIDSRIQQNFEASLKDAQSQIARLTRSRNLWRKIASFGVPTVALVALGIGYLAGHR